MLVLASSRDMFTGSQSRSHRVGNHSNAMRSLACRQCVCILEHVLLESLAGDAALSHSTILCMYANLFPLQRGGQDPSLLARP